MELMVKKQMPKESIEILNQTRNNLNEKLKDLITLDMNDPINESQHEPYFESYMLGLNIVDTLEELLASGFDMLSYLNDKPEFCKQVMQQNHKIFRSYNGGV